MGPRGPFSCSKVAIICYAYEFKEEFYERRKCLKLKKINDSFITTHYGEILYID